MIDQENDMIPIAPDTPLQPVFLSDMGARMVQIGFDQLASALAFQAKCLDRDRTAAQHLCEVWMQARTHDTGAVAQAWQTMTREYLAACVALWGQGMVAAAKTQASYGAMLRDTVLGARKVWLTGAPGLATTPAGTGAQSADWMAYLASLTATYPDGEARPATSLHHARSAGA
ncbi:hypothetical protein [Paraburkholderia tropica]|uniref:hypothetical protein n=1 Tax=Paraburkholderia tropica TaxID=92647 RepID=UPI00161266F7|nr:hypothetical protein [Paraburkholderia tropica]MBB3003549.1 hypothetical protein [Paraburkholderia tropica]MBB6322541.1 hypothetical protein [Paraburkholderia tropica]